MTRTHLCVNWSDQDPNIFVGTVEGYPEIDLVRELLLKKKNKKAYLMRFMSVADDHAKNDMAPRKDSRILLTKR